jgi:hypothetical protein
MIFRTSVACIAPTDMTTEPMDAGAPSLSGTPPIMHLRQGVLPGITTASCPVNPSMAPWTRGFPVLTQ